MLQPQQVLQQCYQLQQKLGRTAAGRQTWLATDLSSQERVIVKLLAFNPQMEWDELKLFEREARVLQALNHPHIPRYRDYFSLERQMFDGVPWFGLVQDYIPGYSLQELLENGKHFTEKQVRIIAERVLEILIYLHELSPPVLHRDIKPSNLILGNDAYIYLVDFGAVQAQAAVTGVTFTVVGTSGYAPLEQFWGRAVAASDLYALGATLIHLLTGVTPADLPIRDSRIQFRDRVSLESRFVSWLEMMIEMTLEKRFSSAKQALEALKSGQFSSTSTIQHSLAKKIPKPKDSRIELHKSADKLAIRIPSRASIIWKRSNYLLRLFYLIFWGSAAILVGSFFLSLFLSFWSVSPLLSVLPLGIFIVVALAIREYLFKQTYISFSQINFEISARTFRSTYNLQTETLENVLGAFLYQNNDGTFAVKLRSETETYILASGLSEIQSAWLVQEIQDWLYS